MRLANKVAIITGAGSGIGRASAYLFAKEGARVAVADINDAGGQETVAAIKASGAEAIFVHTDVSAASEVENLVRATMETFGRIDILFNDAGITHKDAPVEDIDESTWDRVYDVNVKGIFLAVKHAVPYMKKARSGVIINTSSLGATKPRIFCCAYASSKGAIVTLTKALALELAPHNIRVNCIKPGPADTPILWSKSAGKPLEEYKKLVADTVPLGRLAMPEDIASAALYLASDESSMVTGASIEVDGGRSI